MAPKAKVLKKISLPKETKVLSDFKPSYLTVLDHFMIPCYITVLWLYENGIDFDSLHNAIEKLTKQQNFEAIFMSEYRKTEDGRWHRSNKTRADALIIIEAEAQDVSIKDDFKISDLPKGLIAHKACLDVDLYTGKLAPSPMLVIQHTKLGGNMSVVAISMHHVLGDMYPYTLLLSSLADCCNGIEPKTFDLNDKEVLTFSKTPSDFVVNSPPNVFIRPCPPPGPKWLRNALSFMFRRPEKIFIPLFKHITNSQITLRFNYKEYSIKALKTKCKEFLTDNDITCAVIFWALMKARISKVADINKFPDKCHLGSAFSSRKKGRMEPNLPENYFGNATLLNSLTISTKDILNEDEDEAILSIAKAQRKATNALNEPETIEKYLKFIQSQKRPDKLIPYWENSTAPNMMNITNWTQYLRADQSFKDEDRVVYYGTLPGDIRGMIVDGFAILLNGVRGGVDGFTKVKSSYAERFKSDIGKYADFIYV